jgi:hypothetical protein
MSNSDLTDKQISEITKVIKVISESVTSYIEGIKDPTSVPTGDISLYAMQVLSLMCGLSRGYGPDRLNTMWDVSTKLSRRLHAARSGDKVESMFQDSVGIDTHWKN